MQSLFRSPRIVGLFVALLMMLSARTVFAQAVLRNGDMLELRIGGVPSEEVAQFSAPYTVDDNGALNLPYIGSIKVSGMLVNQAQALIETKLKDGKIYTQPTITLNLQATSRFVNVGGQVRSPGRVAYTADLTLMSAINAAGGFNDYADKKRVKFVREGKTEVIDTRKLEKDATKDLKVQPGDQITVPMSIW